MSPYTPQSPAAAARESLAFEATELAQVGADLVNDYDHDGYDNDDDDDGPDLVFYSYDDEPQEQEPVSDLADLAYLDPLALVKAWECALDDLKEAHQERFLPPTQAPLALAQKQAKASFWYGPPPSEASTSKLPAVAPADPAPLPSVVAAPTEPVNHVEHIEYDAPPAKKRKRLTGSQKKARKVAKLNGGERASSSRASSAVQVEAHEHEHEPTYPHGRDVEPEPEPHARVEREPSPEEDRAPPARPLIGPSQPSAALPLDPPTFPSFPPAPPVGARPPAGGALAFPSIPPVASLPSSFPPPPSIPPLTGTEAPLEPETPEQLLEQALWSWFTVGYQTALLHAAAGVARFAPSGAQQGEGGQQ
ncbi:hypothetical protein JCM8208_002611 [Rhodotorula glutinis]